MRRCALEITKQKLSEKELETNKQTECPMRYWTLQIQKLLIRLSEEYHICNVNAKIYE